MSDFRGSIRIGANASLRAVDPEEEGVEVAYLSRRLFSKREPTVIRVLDGAFSKNSALDDCQVIDSNVPIVDDIAVGPNGGIYVSAGRAVLRYSGKDLDHRETFEEFEGNAGALTFHPDGRLLVCVSGQGLAAIDRTGSLTWLNKVEGVPLHCLTAVTTSVDGAIFLADGSTKYPPEKWCWDLMEQNSSGRLLRVESGLEGGITLLHGLRFPHGITLSHDGNDLWFTESWRHSVSRYRGIAGLDPSEVEMVFPNLPGYPARITNGSERTYWLTLFAMRTLLVELVLEEEAFKREMMATVDPAYWIAPSLSTTGSLMEPLQEGAIKRLGIDKASAPPRSYGFVARLNEKGEPIESLQSQVGGNSHGISSAWEFEGQLFIASKGHNRLLRHTLGGKR